MRSITRFLLIYLVCAALGCGGDGGSVPLNNTVSLSGSIGAPSGVLIDSDVNDPNEAYLPNDTPATAQALVNPVSVGGYANVAGAGETGRSYFLGDAMDYFSVTLNADDKVSLTIGDSEAGDLDLCLCDTDGTLIECSVDTDKFESITAPDDDQYLVRVSAVSGASNYILTIGVDLANRTAGSLSSRHDLIPGQAIVRFRETAASNERARAMGMALAGGGEDREVLLTFDETDTHAEAYRALDAGGQPFSADQAVDESLARKLNTLHIIKSLRKRKDVLSADPNYILQAGSTTPNDEFYSLQWHYPQINLPLAWDITTGSSDVIVAVVDTGVLMTHPDLTGNLTDTGYDFISSTSDSNDGDGIDPDPDDPGDSATPGASSFHGTHVAGIIAAVTNNKVDDGFHGGVAGVSWNARIMPIRVLGVGGGTLYDILQGVRYAAGLSNDSGTIPSRPADIINMSLGGGDYSSLAQAVFTQVRDAGIILIAAAGNESTDTPTYPAAYEGVVSVSAVDINGNLASYSNYGADIDVAAPGGDGGDLNGDGFADQIWSTGGNDVSDAIQFNYTTYYGTSMAAPHVAGVVALMKALRPALRPLEFDALLRNGNLTNDIGASGWDSDYGSGLIDAYKSVLAVQNDSIPTVMIVNPTSVNFGANGTEATLTVSKTGSDVLSVASFTESPEPWLTVTEASVDQDGSGTYSVVASRSGLSDGSYRSDITFTTSEGSTIAVPVSLVKSTSSSANAGVHYVLLVDPVTLEAEAQVGVQATDGRYAYNFSNVSSGGRYLIVAGSDRDNNGYINNAGEAMGAYLSLDQITYVDADANLSGLDFTTDLRISISASDQSIGLDEVRPDFRRLR